MGFKWDFAQAIKTRAEWPFSSRSIAPFGGQLALETETDAIVAPQAVPFGMIFETSNCTPGGLQIPEPE
jgi:hypothetical protein